MENRQLLNRSLALAILLSGARPHCYGDMISGPPPRGQAVLSAIDPQGGSEMSLVLTLSFPGKVGIPIDLNYHFPETFEILHSDLDLDRKSAPGEIVARWRGVQTKRQEWTVRFKVTKPGFHRIYGKIGLVRDNPALLRSLQEEIGSSISTLKGSDPEAVARRRVFYGEEQGLSMVGDSLMFAPQVFYIHVWKDGVRIESWDFGSPWKRIMHWWGSRKR